MKVQVRYMAQLRAAAGRSEEEVELPTGSSIADLLQHLAEQRGEAATHLLADRAQARPSLLVVVNETAVPARQSGETTLHENDVVLLLPPVAGG